MMRIMASFLTEEVKEHLILKSVHLAAIGGVAIASVLIAAVAVVPALTVRHAGLEFTGNSQIDIQNNCGRFQAIPEDQSDIYTVPVLLMGSGSTACARLHFTSESPHNTNSADLLSAVRRQADFRIGNYNLATNGQSFSISPGWDHTRSFQIYAASQEVDSSSTAHPAGDNPTYYPAGTNFTITYIIHAPPAARGFYDYSLPRPSCGSYPLSVGFSESQVNSSDFSKANPLGQLCVTTPYKLLSVEVAGMSYKEVRLQTIPFQ